MTRLTEEMVVARSKQSDLASIKKLNCWGAELTDVTICKRMTNVEVLALSINKIRNLADFKHCRRLKELYVRKNRIADLSEIRHLRELPALRILWLGENPCAEDANYRMTVLRALPHLEKLDNINVEPDEVEEAARKGTPIYDSDVEEDYDPELDNYSHQYWNKAEEDRNGVKEEYQNGDQDTDRGQDAYESPPVQQNYSRPSALRRSPPTPYSRTSQESDNHNTTANHTYGSRPSALPRSPPNTNGSNYNQTSPGRQRPYSPDPPEESRYEQQTSRSQYFERSASVGDDLANETVIRQQILDTTMSIQQQQQQGENNNQAVNEVTYRRSIQHSQSAHSIKEPSHMNGEHSRERERDRYQSQHHSARHSMVSPHGECYYERQADRYSSQTLEAPTQPTYSNPPQQRTSGTGDTWERDSVMSNSRGDNSQIASAVMADHKGFTRRPMTRNSNLLSAVLCLVKELDYTSLEVAEMAVRCRMDELANRP